MTSFFPPGPYFALPSDLDTALAPSHSSSIPSPIGSRRPSAPLPLPLTPSPPSTNDESSFVTAHSHRSRSPLPDFDERQAIPSALLDSPPALNRRSASHRHSYHPSDPSVRSSSLFHFFQANTDTRNPNSGNSNSNSNPASGNNTAFNITQNSPDSSYLLDQRYDTTMNFDGPSIQSSVSSSYSLNSYNAPNKKPKQSKSLTHTSGSLSIVREHSHSSFTDNSFAPRSENHRPPSRFLKISGLSKSAELASIVDTLSAFGELRGIYSREISLNGSVIVAFYDLRHSVTAYKSLCSQSIMGHVLQPQFFPKNYLIQMSENGIDMPFATEYDDELTIFFNPGSVEDARAVLENYLPRFGSVLSLKIESDTTISCEFFDLRHAAAAADNIDGNVIRDITFYVSYQSIDHAFSPSTECNDFDNQPGSSALARVSSMPATTRRSTLSVHAPVFEAGKLTLSANRSDSFGQQSAWRGNYSEPSSPRDVYNRNDHSGDHYGDYGNPRAHSRNQDSDYVVMGPPVGAYGRRSPLPFGVYSDVDPAEASLTFQVENAPTSSRYDVYTNATVPKNNVVDLERIARGLDTRTTLMLRNIPNKVDQRMLKDYIDVTNRGTYDFLYLRIDFLNKCNVGYAFISFTSPEAIITFAKARAGTKWNRFNSEKICDISYANIYGKECLIEKFRNSSVMDQDAAYRPKIYYSDGPHKGEEEEFPPPNNLNRKLRSIASIQQIGLFPPGSNSGNWRRVFQSRYQ